jgi:hypothetical protein
VVDVDWSVRDDSVFVRRVRFDLTSIFFTSFMAPFCFLMLYGTTPGEALIRLSTSPPTCRPLSFARLFSNAHDESPLLFGEEGR